MTTKTILEKLGFSDVEEDKLSASFYHEGIYYDIDKDNVTEVSTADEVIKNSYSI